MYKESMPKKIEPDTEKKHVSLNIKLETAMQTIEEQQETILKLKKQLRKIESRLDLISTTVNKMIRQNG